ncbi:MAG: serine/threonine protein phosphatase, partial [Rufibacter sp.]
MALPYFSNLLSVIFIVSVFLLERSRTRTQRNSEFIPPLRNLLVKGGFGAYVSALLLFGYASIKELWVNSPYLLDIFYQVLFGFLVFFLAKAFYTWREFILYQKTKDLQSQWKWFEILVSLSLLVPLLNVEYMNHIFLILDLGLLLAYGLYMSVHLSWVAMLSLDKKWISLFLLSAIMLSLVLFGHFLMVYSDSPDLVVDYTDNPFILISFAF